MGSFVNYYRCLFLRRQMRKTTKTRTIIKTNAEVQQIHSDPICFICPFVSFPLMERSQQAARHIAHNHVCVPTTLPAWLLAPGSEEEMRSLPWLSTQR